MLIKMFRRDAHPFVSNSPSPGRIRSEKALVRPAACSGVDKTLTLLSVSQHPERMPTGGPARNRRRDAMSRQPARLIMVLGT